MNVRASGRQSGFSDRCHPACFACRPAMEGGLGLRFFPGPNGCVEARFACDGRYQGYPDRLHGGIVAMLLDAAMTHCLFAQQIRAFTAKLSLRYLHPVRVDEDCLIVACLRRRRGGAHLLAAEIRQGGRVCALAEATFLAGSEPKLDRTDPVASESRVGHAG